MSSQRDVAVCVQRDQRALTTWRRRVELDARVDDTSGAERARISSTKSASLSRSTMMPRTYLSTRSVRRFTPFAAYETAPPREPPDG